jgi:hypothetical protein
MTDKKTSLTKAEKEKIKDERPSGIMSDEEWAVVQGMTHSDFNRKSSVGSFLDKMEEKHKKRYD